jgi:hypothetical protein
MGMELSYQWLLELGWEAVEHSVSHSPLGQAAVAAHGTQTATAKAARQANARDVHFMGFPPSDLFNAYWNERARGFRGAFNAGLISVPQSSWPS